MKAKGETLGIYSDNHGDIAQLQTFLNNRGYVGKDGKQLSIDGKYGANTKYAVMAYQRDMGLTVDGLVGDITWVNMGFVFNDVKIPTGPANSSEPLYNRKGDKIGERFYGPDGKATKDRDDTDHGNSKNHPDVPHEHEWGPEGRGEAVPVPKPTENSPGAGLLPRVGAIIGGVAIITGTIIEDFASSGSGISNDMQHFQQGTQSILWGFAH
ncbi:MAG: peptidoglycan-binding domain-containing protein [Clostridia bacterium]|nr:peptidoglycan-binding domain-containing protein [Clostridia bacterium]